MSERELIEKFLRAWESGKTDLVMESIRALRERLERPEPTQQWRGLSSAERKVFWNLTKKPSEYAELVEQKLREKNNG